MVQTVVAPYGDEAIAHAARLIRGGQPVAVPTETVYGLAADATNAAAVARIYEAKGRPSFNPLIVHVPDLAHAKRLGVFSAKARELAAAHWPGPLTLVVPLRPEHGLAPAVTAGLATVAIRVPGHPVMRHLLAAAERPLAAPSANASGRISPTSAEHVLATLAGRIPLVLDSGQTPVGIESTIVLVEGDQVRVLRPGPVLADIAPTRGTDPIAPGMLPGHYAPTKPVRLDVTAALPDEWLIGFGAVGGASSLSERGDLVEAAARLYAELHKADASEAKRIAVAPVPAAGFGIALNDRLRRAATAA